MFGLSTLQASLIALLGVSVMLGGAYIKGRVDGRSIGAVETLKAQTEQLVERNETDAEVDKLDRYGLCVDLLGRVPECEEFR